MDILMGKPDWARGFGLLMSTWGESHAMLQHLYPVKERLVDVFDPTINPICFVDVGGGYGQRSIALKKDFPELSGKILVQDLPMFIDTAPTVDGIEFKAHDFFTEQPVKGKGHGRISIYAARANLNSGAKAYYIRQCLHDWPDDACVKILSMLKPALKSGYSKVLIHELIVPETGASTWVSVQDVNMMSLCGLAERSERDWHEIIARAGYSVEKIYWAEDGVSESVIEIIVE